MPVNVATFIRQTDIEPHIVVWEVITHYNHEDNYPKYDGRMLLQTVRVPHTVGCFH
jgi:hypothetical protein